MHQNDEFVVLVPKTGSPKLLRQGEDISAYVDRPGAYQASRTIGLKDGRSVVGSIVRLRETTTADDIAVMDLLNRHFSRPRIGDEVTLPNEDGPGTVPAHHVEKVVRPVDGAWLVEFEGRQFEVRSDKDATGEHIVWLGRSV